MEPTEFRTDVIRPIECAKEAWALIKPNYWLVFAMCLLGIWLSGVTLDFLLGSMVCGIFYALLKVVDGKMPEFSDLWKGLAFFIPGAIVTLFIAVPILIVYAIIYGPIFYAVYLNPSMSDKEFAALLTSGLLLDSIVLVGMVCFHTLLLFAFPLIVDRGLGPMAAILTSAKAVWSNLSGVSRLIFVQFVISFVGFAMVCFGIYLVIPLIFASNAVAYRKVFPAMNIPNLNPPPPNAYSGL